MKVTIELNEMIIEAIAYSQAEKNAYDKLSEDGVKDDLTEMYAVAFADGMEYLMNLIEGK